MITSDKTYRTTLERMLVGTLCADPTLIAAVGRDIFSTDILRDPVAAAGLEAVVAEWSPHRTSSEMSVAVNERLMHTPAGEQAAGVLAEEARKTNGLSGAVVNELCQGLVELKVRDDLEAAGFIVGYAADDEALGTVESQLRRDASLVAGHPTLEGTPDTAANFARLAAEARDTDARVLATPFFAEADQAERMVVAGIAQRPQLAALVQRGWFVNPRNRNTFDAAMLANHEHRLTPISLSLLLEQEARDHTTNQRLAAASGFGHAPADRQFPTMDGVELLELAAAVTDAGFGSALEVMKNASDSFDIAIGQRNTPAAHATREAIQTFAELSIQAGRSDVAPVLARAIAQVGAARRQMGSTSGAGVRGR